MYGLEVSKTCFCIHINLVLLSLLSGIKVTLCFRKLENGLLHALDTCLCTGGRLTNVALLLEWNYCRFLTFLFSLPGVFSIRIVSIRIFNPALFKSVFKRGNAESKYFLTLVAPARARFLGLYPAPPPARSGRSAVPPRGAAMGEAARHLLAAHPVSLFAKSSFVSRKAGAELPQGPLNTAGPGLPSRAGSAGPAAATGWFPQPLPRAPGEVLVPAAGLNFASSGHSCASSSQISGTEPGEARVRRHRGAAPCISTPIQVPHTARRRPASARP